jgi:hypothetical protein
MVVDGIPEASAAAEVLYEAVWPLPLGVKWRLVGHGDGLFFETLHVDC